MRIRFYHARIMTMEENVPLFWGEIHICGDRIERILRDDKNAEISAAGAGSNGRWDLEIDCRGNLLMPGFKNAHTHSPMTFLRSYADDLPLQEWLSQKVFPIEAKLDEECIYAFGRLAILEYLSSGITSIFDMYIMPDVMAKVCMDSGMRCVLVSGLNDFTSSLRKQEEEFLKWNQESPLISYRMGCHAQYTTSEELLKGLAKLASKYQAPVYLHLSETQKEVEDCLGKTGKTPVKYLDDLGLFQYGGGGYHCIYLTEEEFDIFERRGMSAVTNPSSNLKLASGIAPMAEFLKRKINTAIGTDGAASNNCLDMFREMFLVTGLSKIRERDAACMDAGEVLKMATIGGAKAMGLPDADILASGKLADLIMIDLSQPNMQPIHNIPKNLVYSGSKANVKMTMIGGRILYMDGRYDIGRDPEEIYEICAKQLARLFQ